MTDPLARDRGPVPSILQARYGAPCLPAGMSLFDAPLPALRQAIEACRKKAADQARQARAARRQAGACPGCLPAGDARYGVFEGFAGDVYGAHLPDQARAAIALFEARLAAGEIRYGVITAAPSGELTSRPMEHVYAVPAARAARRAAAVEMCQHYARRLPYGAVLCPDS